MDADERQIRELIANWARAVHAQDLDGAIARHSDDVVMFDVPEPLQSIGVDEYRKTWELFFANVPAGPGSFDVSELNLFVGDRVAWCRALVQVHDSTARLTIGLRKEGGQWLIAHEHHSYPWPLKSS